MVRYTLLYTHEVVGQKVGQGVTIAPSSVSTSRRQVRINRATACELSPPRRGLLHEYMGQKRRKCPKKRVSSLLQPHSWRALPGSTARVSAALPGTQGVRPTDQTE